MANRKKGQGVGVLELLALLILVLSAIILIFVLVLGPELYARVSVYLAYLAEQRGGAPPPAPPPQQADPDFRRYFELKARSCQILSKDFLIVTQDYSSGRTEGLLPLPGQEEAAAQILSQYRFNQTTKTYLKGTWMKKVVESGDGNFTSIWKEGTLYQCGGNCTMNRLGDSGWQAHLDDIERIRTGCGYFGRTKMPDSVNMTRLLKIARDGYATLRGNKCERFLISGDRNYTQSLLSSGGLNPDQEAVLWALAHLSGPVEECLDEGTGIVVSRSLSLDLTKTYRLDYSPGGFMRVDQKTDLTFYSSSVPNSFFDLPG